MNCKRCGSAIEGEHFALRKDPAADWCVVPFQGSGEPDGPYDGLCAGVELTDRVLEGTLGDAIRTKQVIVIRKDLKMRRGKEITQGAHASMAFLTRRLGRWQSRGFGINRRCRARGSFTRAEYLWMHGSFRKVTCQVNSEAELREIAEEARKAGLHVEEITDAGLTEFHGVPTLTCIAIGPDYDHKINPVTARLKLY